MATKTRFISGPTIIEVNDQRNHGDDFILLTVSKERWEEDRVQVRLSTNVAKALGIMLQGE